LLGQSPNNAVRRRTGTAALAGEKLDDSERRLRFSGEAGARKNRKGQRCDRQPGARTALHCLSSRGDGRAGALLFDPENGRSGYQGEVT
jgi:hypothetical protein